MDEDDLLKFWNGDDVSDFEHDIVGSATQAGLSISEIADLLEFCLLFI